ncbi:MAG TPA: bifunctional hydroxymethylpyrimidine kinase/phosphomethylpyrimidine kinase [Solirubrobacteraceae bacterium]|nr:bifunctional hydroxymethylpyrimidine kinase/phosphomethylpyrimidine kinase [Solirubrobacteraceae bacterium]
MTSRTPRVLSIAGSDSGGGAGIQADLKALARCGVHGMTAITAITAQSTTGVEAIQPIPPEMVLAQIRAVLGDIGVDAVKVGMLGTAELVRTVAGALRELPAGTPVVVDPVMVAESGARLLAGDAEEALVEEILPLATVLTPNVPEAGVLVGTRARARTRAHARAHLAENDIDTPAELARVRAPARAHLAEKNTDTPADPAEHQGEPGARPAEDNAEEALALARAVLALGPRSVVLTGGHREGGVDVFVEGATAVELPGERHEAGAAHGSGCTHSSVLAAQLALGLTPLEAARVARRLAGEAVGGGLRDIGEGAGPVDILGLEARRAGIIEGR